MKIKSKLKQIVGKYRIVTLHKKPSFVPVSLWMKLYRMGLLNHWIKRTSPMINNLIMFSENHGIHIILQHLAGTSGFQMQIDNAAIGTGTTAPTDADTGLETPVLSNIERSTVVVNSTDIVTEWFMTDDELADGTYNEFGLFQGSQLFARSIITPAHTKASNEDTLVEYTISADNS